MMLAGSLRDPVHHPCMMLACSLALHLHVSCMIQTWSVHGIGMVLTKEHEHVPAWSVHVLHLGPSTAPLYKVSSRMQSY